MRRSVVIAGKARTEDWDAMPDKGTTESAAHTAGRTGSVGVLVVDDSPVYRRGMGRAVGHHNGLELVGEADGGEAALGLRTQLKEPGEVSCATSREEYVLLRAQRKRDDRPPHPNRM